MNKNTTRRDFIRKSALGAATAFAVPSIVPSTVLGKGAPSNKINIAQIGFGRIAMTHDLPETIKNDEARIIAVCDVDSKRARQGKEWVQKWYEENKGKKNFVDVRTYGDYREMLINPDIDAVIVSTPDHWHAQPAIEAALAGKDIYLQKPTSLTIAEGRALSDVIHRTGRVFQIGSQQRSQSPWPQFKKACELVRNGRIGKVHTVYVGLPGDPGGNEEPEMPIPANLNYDMWLGSTPDVYYTEKRVHSQSSITDRPGWLRCEQFGAGMITGWGAHHIDTAHWGMGTEYSGPIEIEGQASFPESGLWNVHGPFKITAKYAEGFTMHISGEYPNGVKFVGEDGWIFVTRGSYSVTPSDPVSAESNTKSLDSSDHKILTSEIGKDEIHLGTSQEQHANWLKCIKTREQTIAPVEVAHRSCSACLLGHTSLKLDRTLFWNPKTERFLNDDEANAMVARPQRFPYGIDFLKI